MHCLIYIVMKVLQPTKGIIPTRPQVDLGLAQEVEREQGQQEITENLKPEARSGMRKLQNF